MIRLTEGDLAPDFDLPDQKGNFVSLKNFKKKKLLIYFFPKADTPGCIKQSCALRDISGVLEKMGVSIVGISPDLLEDQGKFDKKYRLGFPLLSDEEHSVARAYGVWGKKTMYGNEYMGIFRSSFLINGDGEIDKAWYKITPKNTVLFLKKELQIGCS